MTTWSDYPVRGYVTEISIPDFGDGGSQRLHSRPLEGKGEKDMPETDTDPEARSDAGAGPEPELEAQ